MAYTPKDMTGNLFRNDKGDNPKRPDYRGEAAIGGSILEVAAWLKTSNKGTKYLSLKFSFKDDDAARPTDRRPQATETGLDDDSEIPF